MYSNLDDPNTLGLEVIKNSGNTTYAPLSQVYATKYVMSFPTSQFPLVNSELILDLNIHQVLQTGDHIFSVFCKSGEFVIICDTRAQKYITNATWLLYMGKPSTR